MARTAYLKAIGLLVGMIFGAGVFALPFATVKAGIFWGIFYFVLALGLMVLLHLWYGEVSYFAKGRHRLTGYAEIFLGKCAKWFAFFLAVFADYGALLVYGLLGGLFLANFLPLSPFVLSLLIFSAGGIVLFFHFEKVAGINFYLTIALLGMIMVLFIIAFPNIKFANFSVNPSKVFSFDWFLPYGIWLFALSGFSAVPEVRDILFGFPLRNLKKVILTSLLLCAALYSIFVFTIIGIGGNSVTEDALNGAIKVLGESALIIGSLLGFLAIFGSFIALGADLKNIFHYDFRFPKRLAWLSVVIPPIILFLSGLKNFIGLLEIVGSVGLGLTGILIILMARRLPGRKNDKKFLGLSWIVLGLLSAGIIAAVISKI